MLTRRYGRMEAVKDVSFSIPQKEVFALLGPNGSGKSTLLRMLCGYLQPSAGSVSILGHDLLNEPRHAKSAIGYVPDESSLYGHMEVQAFLRYMAALKNVPSTALQSRVRSVIERLALGEVLGKKIGALSRGYRQRVSIAQAIVNQPKIVFMDEPTNGLDPTQIRQWRQLMLDLAEDCTVIFTSHILDEVVAIADRVGLLVAGQLRAIESLSADTSLVEILVRNRDLKKIRSMQGSTINNTYPVENDLARVSLSLDSNETMPSIISALTANDVDIFSAKPVNSDLEAVFFGALTEQEKAG